MSRKRATVRSIATLCVASGLLLTAGAVTAAPAADPSEFDTNTRASSWQEAASRLGTAGSLWEPAATAGLRRTTKVSVVADNLAFQNGAAVAGDTFAGGRYGRGQRSFWVNEKWADTGWAAEPAFTTSTARVGRVRIPIGPEGTRIHVTATVLADCFAQPSDADPREIPRGFRCSRADVLRTGGYLVMTARPPSTMTDPGRTSIVLSSTGLSYAELVRIASSLEQVGPTTADGAGSAQMVAMCGQMVTAAMTPDQASAFAQSNGYSTRVGTIDGQSLPVTADYRPDRFTLTVAGNAVTACDYG